MLIVGLPLTLFKLHNKFSIYKRNIHLFISLNIVTSLMKGVEKMSTIQFNKFFEITYDVTPKCMSYMPLINAIKNVYKIWNYKWKYMKNMENGNTC